MKEEDLISRINVMIKNGNRICKGQKDVYTKDLKRLKAAKKALSSGSFDAVEFCDLFEINNENKTKSYNALRLAQGGAVETIKAVRPLHVCVYNADNNYQGEYIQI